MKEPFTVRVLLIVTCAVIDSSCGHDTTISQQSQQDGKDLSVLLTAVQKGKVASVRKCLAMGADMNATDANGQTVLMHAASDGNVEIMRLLLNAGANVNARTVDGYTALHAASVDKELEAVNSLIAAGADVNARTRDNVTPLMSSIGSPYSNSGISLALIRSGADVNIVDSEGETPLWIATTNCEIEVIEELLKRGADLNFQKTGQGFTGDTPLHMAAMNGLKDVVELLLRYGANPTIRNAKGETPSDVVNKRSSEIREILSTHIKR